VTVPAATPVTFPDEFTVAKLALEEDHVRDVLVADTGKVVGTSVTYPPIGRLTLLNAMEDTGVVTVAAESAEKDPFAVVTRIVVVPLDTPVTTPLVFTVATDVFKLDHATFWLEAFVG
jgi:hypothetical protein